MSRDIIPPGFAIGLGQSSEFLGGIMTGFVSSHQFSINCDLYRIAYDPHPCFVANELIADSILGSRKADGSRAVNDPYDLRTCCRL